MLPRFYFQEPSAADRLLASADELKIQVLRINGRLVAEFDIKCHVGELFDEDDDGQPLPEPDTLGAVRDVLALFEKGGAS